MSRSAPDGDSPAAACLGGLATMQSIISTRLAIDAAFCSASRVAFAGSKLFGGHDRSPIAWFIRP